MKRLLLIFSLIVCLILALLFLGQILFEKTYHFPKKIKYGVTFSPKFAQALQLDWKKTYSSILDELKVKSIRLPGYWDVLEKKMGQIDFSELDFMIGQADKKGAQIILVLGARQPRWPECHVPTWAKSLTVEKRQEKILEFITKVVQKYQNNPALMYWQVENEPLLGVFGEGCDPVDEKFLKSEVELVRSLDKRPIIVSDSGELGYWITPMRLSDIFGTTLYHVVYNSVLGYTKYPILPYLYNLKSQIIRGIFAPNNQKTIIVELQAEPWSSNNALTSTPIKAQMKIFSTDNFRDYINYAQKTGFDEAYLWGVEWWYWMSMHNHPEYLDYAKTLFK